MLKRIVLVLGVLPTVAFAIVQGGSTDGYPPASEGRTRYSIVQDAEFNQTRRWVRSCPVKLLRNTEKAAFLQDYPKACKYQSADGKKKEAAVSRKMLEQLLSSKLHQAYCHYMPEANIPAIDWGSMPAQITGLLAHICESEIRKQDPGAHSFSIENAPLQESLKNVGVVSAADCKTSELHSPVTDEPDPEFDEPAPPPPGAAPA